MTAERPDIYMELVRYAKEEADRRKTSLVRVPAEEAAKGTHVISNRLGFHVRTFLTFGARHEQPGANIGESIGHRHNAEAIIFHVSGGGYSMIDGRRYDWQGGDFLLVPPYSWHRHMMTEPTVRLAITSTPLNSAIGVAIIEDERYPEHWVFAQKGDAPNKTLIPGVSAAAAEGPVENGSQGWTGGLSAALYRQELDSAFEEERNRRSSRVLVKAKDIHFDLTPLGDLAYVVDPRLGFHAKALSAQVLRISAGKHSGAHRHMYEEGQYVIAGQGYCIVEDERYDTRPGDWFFIPMFHWHQHFNSGDEESRILLLNTRPAIANLGDAYTEQGESAD